jgi:hypothetical protein
MIEQVTWSHQRHRRQRRCRRRRGRDGSVKVIFETGASLFSEDQGFQIASTLVKLNLSGVSRTAHTLSYHPNTN